MRTTTLLLGIVVVLAVVHSTSSLCACKKKKAPPPPAPKCGCVRAPPPPPPKKLKKCGCGKKRVGLALNPLGIVKPIVGAAVAAPVAVLKSLSETEVKEKYARQSGEPLDSWFKRIVDRSYTWTSTNDAYIKTLTTIWKDFADIDLWYNRKYLPLSKEFYTVYYAKQDNECWDHYYARLAKREAWETDECFAKRITVIRDCFPTLDLWTSEKWFSKYTRPLYALEFKRWSTESETDYIERIFEKDSYFDVSDDVWAKRLFFVQEATITSCPLWYNEKYSSYFKKYYSIFYRKKDTESCDVWLPRALAPLPGESLDSAVTRIKFIKEVTGDCGCWKKDYFKKIELAKSFQDDWLIRVKKSFFPCGCVKI